MMSVLHLGVQVRHSSVGFDVASHSQLPHSLQHGEVAHLQ